MTKGKENLRPRCFSGLEANVLVRPDESSMMAPESEESTTNIGHAARTLSAEEIEHLKKDTMLVSSFKQTKLEKEAEKNWDLFYKRNTTKFFKDRHWTTREFEELIRGGEKEADGSQQVILEVGCGVGNFIFPLLEGDQNHSLFFYACDFSKRAVQFVKENPNYDSSLCEAFHADVTKSLTATVPLDSVDIATMIFVLSAIHPDKMLQALKNVQEVLKPGGVLLLRDYGLYDFAMLRFAPGHKLSENLYVRQDGTRAYYFSLEVLQELAEKAELTILSNQYIHRETINKKEGLCVPRIFVQAKFAKPLQDPSLDLLTPLSMRPPVLSAVPVAACTKGLTECKRLASSENVHSDRAVEAVSSCVSKLIVHETSNAHTDRKQQNATENVDCEEMLQVACVEELNTVDKISTS